METKKAGARDQRPKAGGRGPGFERAGRGLGVAMMVGLLAGCDQARDEYSYKLPNPPPTMPPPGMAPTGPPQQAGAGAPRPSGAALDVPQAVAMDFSAEKPPTAMKMRSVEVAGVGFSVPELFEETTSGRPMRAAEFRIPGTDDSTGSDGELVVFHFGPGQGGTPADNIARWVRQFAAEADTPPPQHGRGTVGGLAISWVMAFGTYTPASMGGGPSAPQPGSGLIGLIIEGGPEGSLFIRATGPARTVLAAEAPMKWLAGSASAKGGAPAATPEPAPTQGIAVGEPTGANDFAVAGLFLPVPQGWITDRPSGGMRAAQFLISEGDQSAEVAVFHFGAGQGGSVEDNLSRWIRQIAQPDGSETQARREKNSSGSLTIHQVIAEGTYTPAAMGGAPAQPRPDTRLHGIVVEGGPEGTVFIRATGPAKFLAEHEAQVRAFALGIRAGG